MKVRRETTVEVQTVKGHALRLVSDGEGNVQIILPLEWGSPSVDVRALAEALSQFDLPADDVAAPPTGQRPGVVQTRGSLRADSRPMPVPGPPTPPRPPNHRPVG